MTIHKAEPLPGTGDNGVAYCRHCDHDIKRVPGGQGPTWVHEETGAVAGYDREPEGEQDFTDATFVLGAVLAQLEELTTADKRRVLFLAIDAVEDEDEPTGYVTPVHPPRAANQRPTS